MQLTDLTDALSLTRQMIDIPSVSGQEGPLADAVEAALTLEAAEAALAGSADCSQGGVVERGLSLERRVLGAVVAVEAAEPAGATEPASAELATAGAGTLAEGTLGETAATAAVVGEPAAAELATTGTLAVAELAALREELSTTGVEALRTRTTGVASVLSGSLAGCTESGRSFLAAGFFLGFFAVFFADFFAGSLVLRIKPVNTKAAIRDSPRAKIA